MYVTLLDTYLFRQFFKNFFLVIVSLISIYFLVDFFERIDNFMDAQKSLGLALKYFLFKIPFMADMIYPVSLLLAGIITLGLLNHSKEYLALKAGGVSTLRICLPLIIIAALMNIASLALAEWLLPRTQAETNRIWYQEVNHHIPKGVEREGRTFHRGIKGIYSFTRSDPRKHVYKQFSYAEWDEDYQLARYIMAEEAVWNQDIWTLHSGQIQTAFADDPEMNSIDIFSNKVLQLPEGPEQFFVPTYKANEQSISNLFRQAMDQKGNNNSSWLDLNGRLSFIFIGLPLVLIGLPVLLILHQKWGWDLTLAIPASCGLAFAAWGWWSTSQSLTKAYGINPVVASWIIHCVISAAGIWLLKKQDS